jgi:cytoskeletal protein RodZ
MTDIGSTLREARMRARIDISEVEARTKIRAKYLRAIENEEWDLLPGPVYVKSFLRTYGDYLGLDTRLLIDEFKRRYERPSDHDLRPISSLGRERERERRRRSRSLPPWMTVGAILIAVVVVLFVIGLGANNQNKPSPTSALPGAHRHRATTPTATTTPVHRPVTPAVATLQLKPTGTVYVCVEDLRHRKLIPGRIFAAGAVVPVERRQVLLVTLGNASVQMTVNGRPYRITPSASAIGLRVSPKGVTPLHPGPTCT